MVATGGNDVLPLRGRSANLSRPARFGGRVIALVPPSSRRRIAEAHFRRSVWRVHSMAVEKLRYGTAGTIPVYLVKKYREDLAQFFRGRPVFRTCDPEPDW